MSAQVLYTEDQLKVLFWVGYPSAVLNVFASITIIYLVLGAWKDSGTYNRIMLGLSMYELLFAFGLLVFKNWSVPKDSGMAHGAVGNTTTCTINGFFNNMIVGSMYYTAFLAVYFVLKIRMEVQEATICRYYEPICHVVPSVVCVGSGIYGILAGGFNPTAISGTCWFIHYPINCKLDDQVECIRGEDTVVVARVLLSGTVVITLMTLIASMGLIVSKVWFTERRLLAYGHGTTARWNMTKESGIQAILYIGCFLISFGGLAPVQLSPKDPTPENAHHYYVIVTISSILAPLSGVFNAIIYIRPRYQELTGPGGRLSLSMRGRSFGSASSCGVVQPRQSGGTNEGNQDNRRTSHQVGTLQAESSESEVHSFASQSFGEKQVHDGAGTTGTIQDSS